MTPTGRPAASRLCDAHQAQPLLLQLAPDFSPNRSSFLSHRLFQIVLSQPSIPAALDRLPAGA